MSYVYRIVRSGENERGKIKIKIKIRMDNYEVYFLGFHEQNREDHSTN